MGPYLVERSGRLRKSKSSENMKIKIITRRAQLTYDPDYTRKCKHDMGLIVKLSVTQHNHVI